MKMSSSPIREPGSNTSPGVDQGADVVLMVVDPSFESLQLAEKVGIWRHGSASRSTTS